ncbi:HAL/PAL/TAL family ammonia-lyase [Salidesulfovibrio brasiliensis]|uniref:HAL/PAL/TAL family ammonia-lyase n=1 Tax=Salidesulfovibrio brasiliensis TaxID=221711 RepID=UPI0006CFBD1E|nr:aromatic amino acid ammonia-lyase [Salidesulfovibrio brasiliensis]
MTVVIDHRTELTLEQVAAVAQQKVRVQVAPETIDMLAERRAQVERFVSSQNVPAYGFNRGFGHNVDLAVDARHLEDLQRNLILSHAVGQGDHAPDEVVRAAMLLRAASLSRGNSGIRPVLVETLTAMLNADVIPLVPELGSVGASGDLAPLSHIAMAVMGEGDVRVNGETVHAAKAMQDGGIQPVLLEMKEGLALNNGVQFMAALSVLACQRLKDLLRAAAVNTSLTAQVMLAPDTYFRPDFHAVRPHPGAVRVADWIWRLMQDSPIRNSHKDFKVDGQVQDPYNIRCAAQVLGTCHDLVSQAEAALLVEINSATDNPIMLPNENGEYTDIVSGGHFHGMPVAVQAYNLMQALSIMTSLSHTRSVRFVDPARNKGLGRDLKWPGLSAGERAVSSGMMMLEYTSASLTNDIWGKAMPSHLFNISTNSGQEDHVSMGTTLAVRLYRTLPEAASVLAVELAYILQPWQSASGWTPSQPKWTFLNGSRTNWPTSRNA